MPSDTEQSFHLQMLSPVNIAAVYARRPSSARYHHSESNILIITRRDRFKLFIKLYWKTLIIVGTPILLLPIAFIGENYAYPCFYIFLTSVVYWVTDVMHPSATAMMLVAFYSLITIADQKLQTQIYVTGEVLDALAMMMLGIAIDNSQVNKRVALKTLMIFGCSHYRLSFLLFFATMALSAVVSGIVACGLMMTLVKAILIELEKMGILEMYETIGKTPQQSVYHQVRQPRPTEFTIFYFLGIACSSSIGGMATILGSHVNQIMKSYFERLFPLAPKIEFPHFMLLNLPAVLLQETLLYLWMNSYFMGMFRANSSIALEIGMSEEEAAYIKTLLTTQYQQLGKIKFHEWAVGSVVIFTCIIQTMVIAIEFGKIDHSAVKGHLQTSAPCLVGVVILFILPTNLNFLQFFKKRESNSGPLPQFPTRTCLNWSMIKRDLHWSVVFITAGSSFIFEALRESSMTVEFEKFLLLFSSLYSPLVVFVVIVFCKILTEFASNPCVAHCLLPSIARLGVESNINPHCLMMAATLSSALPFHLITGSPTNAMVAAYAYIRPRRMMYAGIGPSVAAIFIIWFTVGVWAKAIWTDIFSDGDWWKINTLNDLGKHE